MRTTTEIENVNSAELERRGRAMRAFCDSTRLRGDVAVVEEKVDLPRLRAAYLAARTRELGVCRLDELGPTPVDKARVNAIRREMRVRARRRGR